MCDECKKEYENPLDRRYHAQPISCIKCGPTLSLKSIDGELIATNFDAIERVVEIIKEGYIVAVKGMGGFHLICDATNTNTLKDLRERKNRPTKPFAVMFKNIEQIKEFADVTSSEEDMIFSQTRPIVLVKTKKELNPLIAPNIDRLGVFMPYTPLHITLTDKLNSPIVATSANLSGEPIVFDECNLRESLGDVVEFYLDYNREIVNSSDDSVVQIIDNKSLIMRASRGITPASFLVDSEENRKILAVGAHQKNSISIYLNKQIITSPYIGDLDSLKSVEIFKKIIENFKKFYNFEPDLIVCDKHPRYESTIWAKSQNLPVKQVQHHYAHILSVMLEKKIDEKVLGIAWDGTGYGDDGTIWGGEFLLCDKEGYERVAHFEPFLLLGGEASIKDIKRVALSMILDCDEDKIYDDFFKKFKNSELKFLKQMHTKELNSPKCSAVGRLFDMVASICGVCSKVSYDGESGLIIEGLYEKSIEDSYNFYLEDGIIRYKHTIKEMIKDKSPNLIATKFINALIKILIEISHNYSEKIVLSGGVFQNRTLLEGVINSSKVDIYFPNQVSINDGGISIGQIYSIL